jgi:hypothetical protein
VAKNEGEGPETALLPKGTGFFLRFYIWNGQGLFLTDRISLSNARGTRYPVPAKGDGPLFPEIRTVPLFCLVGSAPKDDTDENRQGQGIMSPKVIYGQFFLFLTDYSFEFKIFCEISIQGGERVV